MQFDPNAAQSNSIKGKFVASLDVSEALSKAGNPMFRVELTINVNGRDRKAWDYIGGWNLWKLKELAAVCGLADKFAAGVMEDVDLDGQVVGVEVAPDKDDADKIAIKHYIPQNEVVATTYQAAAPARQAEPEPDDDIPF